MAETADRAEDRIEGAPQIGPTVPPSIVTKNHNVASVIEVMKSHPNYKRFADYPGFMWKVANYFVTYNAPPPWWEEQTWAKANGVPASLLSTGGGGGSGINRANTIRSFETAILNRSTALGMQLTPEEISYLATVAESQDFSSEQLMNAIVGLADFTKVQAGQLTASVDQMKALSSSYLINVSDATLQDYAKKLATGSATAEGIESFLKAQSKALNPWMAEYIDAGVKPEELLSASRDMISRMLEVDANTVDFTDQRFMDMATVSDDKGTTRLASNRELAKNIRKDDAWKQTGEARSAAVGTAGLIAKIFGRSVY